MNLRFYVIAFLMLLGGGGARLTETHAQMPTLAPLPGTGAPKTASAPFTFIVAGDNRPVSAATPQPTTPGAIFNDVSSKYPSAAFIFWTGDTVYGKDNLKTASDLQQITAQYKEFLALAQQAGVPVYNAPGNHEMDDKNSCPSAQMQALYQQQMSLPYGAFTYQNARFIALNTEEVPRIGTKSAPVPDKKGSCKTSNNGYVSPAQISLLEQDIIQNQAQVDHIFIFMHRPILPEKAADALAQESAAALMALFKKYPKVHYVLAGHEHLYYNATTKDISNPPNLPAAKGQTLPFYLVSGGAGAPFKGSCPPGSFHHYLVFTVDGANVTTSLVQLDNTTPPCTPAKN
ncbi:MAG TPA: metallophosphoesterase [Pyrinomonadaceae bacterium]|jgi:hypothetical protein